MLKDEILNGETDVLEFKRDMPDDQLKFLMTAVAFANCSGGRIIFGVEDDVKMMIEEGHSRARNKALALACRNMRIIEE